MQRARIFRTGNFKLTAVFALLLIGASLVLTGAMYWVTEHALRSNFVGDVETNIAAVEEGFRNEGLPEAMEVIRQLTSAPLTTDYYLLQSRAGEKLAGNLPAMTPVFTLSALPADGGPAGRRILGEGKLLPDGSYLFAGADASQLIQAQRYTLVAFVTITGITLALTLAAGTALSAAALKRTDAIIDVCHAIAAEQWDRRIPIADTGTENELLAGTINGMLDKLTALMASLRQVSTDIAHDLRQPLSHMRQRLERALIEARDPAEYTAAMERALADSDEILSIFSALLSLAQLEAGLGGAKPGRVDISTLLAELAETYQPVADDSSQTLKADIAPALTLEGDRMLLMQMFTNLIENAIRHSPARARILVSLKRDGNDAIMRVIDTGPGIALQDRARVFERFWRAEASRGMPGHGLGLPLVAAIAKRHRMEVALTDNAPGLSVEVRAHLATS